jgi:hypothetical protein
MKTDKALPIGPSRAGPTPARRVLASSLIPCEGSAKLSTRHFNDGGRPNKSAADRADCKSIGPRERTNCAPRSQVHHGRELASVSDSSASRLLQLRNLFCVKRTNARPAFENVLCRALLSDLQPLSDTPIDTAISRATPAIPISARARARSPCHYPGMMSFDFPPAGAGAGTEPGVQIAPPLPPALPAPLAGVQISPRDAATPSSPAAVVTRGPNRLR